MENGQNQFQPVTAVTELFVSSAVLVRPEQLKCAKMLLSIRLMISWIDL